MSSAGVIYKHYGREVIENISKTIFNKELAPSELELIYQKIYKNLFLEIDANDNGERQANEKLRYTIHTSLSGRIHHMNPPWNCPKPDPSAQFKKAMKICE